MPGGRCPGPIWTAPDIPPQRLICLSWAAKLEVAGTRQPCAWLLLGWALARGPGPGWVGPWPMGRKIRLEIRPENPVGKYGRKIRP